MKELSLNLSNRFYILVLVPLCFELLLLAGLGFLLVRAEEMAARTTETRNVVQSINTIIRLLYAGGVAAVESRLHRSDAIDRVSDEIESQVSLLSKIASQNPAEQASIRRVQLLVRSGKRFIDGTMDTKSEGWDLERALSKHEPIALVTRVISELTRIERQELQLEERERREWLWLRNTQVNVLLAGVIVSIILGLGCARLFHKAVVHRLGVLGKNTLHIANSEELEQPLVGQDEIAALDNALRDLYTQQKRIEEIKREFLARVTHDLRSPLTSQMFFLSCLAEGLQDGSQDIRKQASMLMLDLERLLNMISNLLDFERMDKGKLLLHPKQHDAGEVLEAALTSVDGMLKSKRVSTDKQIEEGITILADYDRLIQVLVNLLSNSAKFTPTGSTLTVRAQNRDGLCEIQIQDEGPGVPPDLEHTIFQRFEQSKNQTIRAGGSSGLGLSISKSLTEAQSGTIGYFNTPTGACFWLRLPLR